MRWLLLLAMLPLPVTGQYTLYTCMVTSKDYVVGAKLPPSGIFRKPAAGEWRHAGFNHPFINALDYDPRDPGTLYVAAGNGLIRVREHGERWKILTGSEVTELQDVSVDRHAPGTIYFSHTAGIRVTHDGGATWSDASAGLHRKYTQAIRVDSRKSGVLVAGNEEGIFRSEDGGKSWRLRGRRGIPGAARRAIAARRLLLAGRHAGRRRCSCPPIAASPSRATGIWAWAAIFPTSLSTRTIAHRIAVAGWGVGVAVSEDRGKTWQLRNAGLPSSAVWSVAFDPAKAGPHLCQACTKRRSTCRRTTAARGPGTGWKAAASFA